jgi:hypothetical protein
MSKRVDGQLCAIAHFKFLKDVVEMSLDRGFCYRQALRDFGIPKACRDETDDFSFATRQPFRT